MTLRSRSEVTFGREQPVTPVTTLAGVRDLLEAELVVGEERLNRVIEMVCAADLMSDVLSFAKSNSLLLTGLTNPQAIRTAEVAEMSAICFVQGKRPLAETIQLAREVGIPVLCTSLTMFESCGRLFRAGMAGCSEVENR